MGLRASVTRVPNISPLNEGGKMKTLSGFSQCFEIFSAERIYYWMNSFTPVPNHGPAFFEISWMAWGGNELSNEIAKSFKTRRQSSDRWKNVPGSTSKRISRAVACQSRKHTRRHRDIEFPWCCFSEFANLLKLLFQGNAFFFCFSVFYSTYIGQWQLSHCLYGVLSGKNVKAFQRRRTY